MDVTAKVITIGVDTLSAAPLNACIVRFAETLPGNGICAPE